MPFGFFQRKRTPEIDRFMAKVKVLNNGCWEWQGSKMATGYGNFHTAGREGKHIKAHRWSYQYFVGPIPKGYDIDHVCRNPSCVNPSPKHLEAVDHRTNMLRGNTIAAKNLAKTHCIHGHEFTRENTRITREGFRKCRTCEKIKDSKRLNGWERDRRKRAK